MTGNRRRLTGSEGFLRAPEMKFAPCDLKRVDLDGVFEGYASVFGREDLARSVWLTTYDAPMVEAEAVAWMIKNRLLWGYRPAADAADTVAGSKRKLLQICRQFIHEEYGAVSLNGGAPAAFDNAQFSRAFSTICLVWNGDVEDPTNGATRCHRHDQLPNWAMEAEPSALIGSRFFY